MISGLDHVVLLLNDLASGIATYRALLGREPVWRSLNDGAATVLFTLDNTVLELMAPAGNGPTADRIRAVLVEQGEGLASLCFRTDDMAKMHRRLERVALKPDAVAEVTSTEVTTGAELTWKRTRAATDLTRGVRLFFLELAQPRPVSPVVTPAPVLGLDHVVISTQDPERSAALYGARLGLDLALDRAHPDWGQLMFFRCGDLVVELVHRYDPAANQARDKLWGLSWRIADIVATRARLVAAGLDVSEIRAGRKPGTRVMNLRSGACGVATLLVQVAK
jgi:catechol 2,3-dioxygenase-like lactoylglutathione lyase family enzyme